MIHCPSFTVDLIQVYPDRSGSHDGAGATSCSWPVLCIPLYLFFPYTCVIHHVHLSWSTDLVAHFVTYLHNPMTYIQAVLLLSEADCICTTRECVNLCPSDIENTSAKKQDEKCKTVFNYATLFSNRAGCVKMKSFFSADLFLFSVRSLDSISLQSIFLIFMSLHLKTNWMWGNLC